MESTNHLEYPVVDRESLESISFPSEEVLEDVRARQERSSRIHRATSLGNLELKKVMIVFDDGRGIKKVHTTIWAQTFEKIVLKDGIIIPVHRIVDIIL